MENSMDIIIMAFGAIMFCAGISLFIMQNNEMNKLLDNQKEIIYSNKVMY